MGWEKRGEHRYYYRKSRGPDGRVESAYVGAGALAHLTAELDGAMRAYGRYREAALGAFAGDVEAADAAVRACTDEVRGRLAAALREEGYRYHRGEWRRPRQSEPPEEASSIPVNP